MDREQREREAQIRAKNNALYKGGLGMLPNGHGNGPLPPLSPGRGSLEVADLDDEEEEEEEESDDNVRVLASARCCRRRGEDATINIRWEVRGVCVTQGGLEVVAVRGGSRCRRPAIHCASADHCDCDAGRCRSAVRRRLRRSQRQRCHRAGCNESGRWTAR